MPLSRLRTVFEPALRQVFHFYWRFSRGMTLGVRALVIDEAGRVFLIKHSYVSGWHLPGGGVEPHETALEALARELKEEGNIDLMETPAFHGLFHNSRVSGRDHVAVYVVRAFRQGRHRSRPTRLSRTAFLHPANCRRRPRCLPAHGSRRCIRG